MINTVWEWGRHSSYWKFSAKTKRACKTGRTWLTIGVFLAISFSVMVFKHFSLF